MICILFALIFGQQIDLSADCKTGICVIDNIPFGVGRETADWQMHQIAPAAVREVREGGAVIAYHGYKFQGIQETRDFQFVYSAKGQLQEIGMILAPTENDNHYPTVINLYFTIRDAIQASELYDSVEFCYKFKSPYNGTTEKEAMDGDLSGSEEDALKQDQNGKLSKYRFGKVWSIFQNRKNHAIKAILSVSIPESGDQPVVLLQYKDARLSNGGYVRGIDSTYTMGNTNPKDGKK